MTDKGMFEDAALIKKLQASIKDEKERRQFAENELALIKGVGNNSPEMKTLKKRVDDLMEVNNEHQKLNGKLYSELEIEKKNHTLTREDNDMLNKEIGRLMDKLSKKSS